MKWANIDLCTSPIQSRFGLSFLKWIWSICSWASQNYGKIFDSTVLVWWGPMLYIWQMVLTFVTDEISKCSDESKAADSPLAEKIAAFWLKIYTTVELWPMTQEMIHQLSWAFSWVISSHFQFVCSQVEIDFQFGYISKMYPKISYHSQVKIRLGTPWVGPSRFQIRFRLG